MSTAGGCLWGNGALYSMDMVEFQGKVIRVDAC